MVTPSLAASVKSDRPIRPGACACGKTISLPGPDTARQCRIRRCRVRSTPAPKRPGCWSCRCCRTVVASMPGCAVSSGTISLAQTSTRGSGRVRQVRRGFCEGSTAPCSILRAVRVLMPTLAAAASWVWLRRSVMYRLTCLSLIRAPGTAERPHVATVPRDHDDGPASQASGRPVLPAGLPTGQDGCRQPARMIVALHPPPPGRDRPAPPHQRPVPEVLCRRDGVARGQPALGQRRPVRAGRCRGPDPSQEPELVRVLATGGLTRGEIAPAIRPEEAARRKR